MKIETKAVATYFLFSWVALSGAAWARMVDAEAGGPKEHERAMREAAADRDHGRNSERAGSVKDGGHSNGDKAKGDKAKGGERAKGDKTGKGDAAKAESRNKETRAAGEKAARGGSMKGLDLKPHDKRSELDRNLAELAKFSEKEREAKEKEQMRDKTHDGRLRLNESTSLGIDVSSEHVVPNVRFSTDRPRKEQKPPR